MFLLDDILLAPVSGFKFILGQIQKMADQELNDDTVIKEQLLELQMRLELEEISDEEYKSEKRKLFARLRALKTRQLELLHQVTAQSLPALLSKSVAMTKGGFWEPGERE
jgi:competence protein ComGF